MVDGLNAIGKRYMYQLMSNVQLPGFKRFDSQILMHSCTLKNDVSMDKELKKICLRMIVKMESLISENIGKYPIKENGQTESIMFRIILILHTNM